MSDDNMDDHIKQLLSNVVINVDNLTAKEITYILGLITKDADDKMLNLAGNLNLCDKNPNKNIRNAIEYYELAAKKKNIISIKNLAHFYSKNDKNKDIQNAIKYYEQAIFLGDKISVVELAILYEENGDIENAIKYYEKGVTDCTDVAMNNLGFLYFTNKNFVDIEKSITYFKMAASLKNVTAMRNLGEVYIHAGKYENIPEAIKYYKMAVELGDKFSIIRICNLFSKLGNTREYVKYLRMVADDDYTASFNLGAAYVDHLNDSKMLTIDILDVKESYKYFKKSFDLCDNIIKTNNSIINTTNDKELIKQTLNAQTCKMRAVYHMAYIICTRKDDIKIITGSDDNKFEEYYKLSLELGEKIENDKNTNVLEKYILRKNAEYMGAAAYKIACAIYGAANGNLDKLTKYLSIAIKYNSYYGMVLAWELFSNGIKIFPNALEYLITAADADNMLALQHIIYYYSQPQHANILNIANYFRKYVRNLMTKNNVIDTITPYNIFKNFYCNIEQIIEITTDKYTEQLVDNEIYELLDMLFIYKTNGDICYLKLIVKQYSVLHEKYNKSITKYLLEPLFDYLYNELPINKNICDSMALMNRKIHKYEKLYKTNITSLLLNASTDENSCLFNVNTTIIRDIISFI